MRNTGKDFMKHTQYCYEEASDQSKGLPQPPLELPYGGGHAALPLPAFASIHLQESHITRLLEQRRSLRKHSIDALTLEELSYLLWCTQGVREQVKNKATFRTVPSAGARHAFETYLLINRVEGLEPGLYRYMALEHHLAPVDLGQGWEDAVTEACLGQPFIKSSAMTFIWTAVVERMKWRYGERGYRYLHLDAGHVCQNLYLAAESIACGACAVAAFDDEKMNNVLHLDGEEQFTIYICPVGRK